MVPCGTGYILLPAATILVFFSPRLIGAIALIASIGAVYWALRPANVEASRLQVLIRNTWPYLVVAGVAVWLSGTLPPFAENPDWYKHYGLFNDLVSHDWPPLIPLGDRLATLRYSLGYYAVPAAMARMLGIAALPASIFVWTTIGLYLTFLLGFGAERSGVAKRFLLPVIFLLFSGADILGQFLTGSKIQLLLHFEWWARFGELASSTTNLFWTPQHALAGWIAAFLVLGFPRRSLSNAGVMGAALAIWSPFCAVGLVPILLWALLREGVRPLLSLSNFLAGLCLLIVTAGFLLGGSSGIPALFVWHTIYFNFSTWAAFLLIEFGAICLALLLARPLDKQLIVIGAGALALLSCFCVGANNDLLMRGSIPVLGMLAVLAARTVTRARGGWKIAPLVVCLVIGAITPLGEIMRAVVQPRISGREHASIVDVIRSSGMAMAPQYLLFEPHGLVHAPVIRLPDLRFETFGQATFDVAQHRVSADTATDAALVSNEIALPAGLYEIEAIIDGNASAGTPGSHAAHLSQHGKALLIAIPGKTYTDEHFKHYFYADGKTLRLSFGLGGWGSGSGSVVLKDLTISRITRRWYW